MDHKRKCKMQNSKFLEDKTEESLDNTGIGDDNCLNIPTKA